MSHRDAYDTPSLAVLETIYRGLYSALTHDPVLRDRLVVFLPYYINYERDGKYHVMLVHPEDRLGIALRRKDAKQFFVDNKTIITEAVTYGRSEKSYAHTLVGEINGEPGAGARIHDANRGKLQYRELIIREKGGDPSLVAEGEYITTACPHLYPTLGVLCQQNGEVIGMVSMDFDDQLCEKVEAVFNTYMEPFNELIVWLIEDGQSLVTYFKDSNYSDTPYAASAPWHDPPTERDPPADRDLTSHIRAIEKAISERDVAHLRRILKRCECLFSTPDEIVISKHGLLKALHGHDRVNPAAWVALDPKCDDTKIQKVTKEHFVAPWNYKVTQDTADRHKEFSRGVGSLLGELPWVEIKIANESSIEVVCLFPSKSAEGLCIELQCPRQKDAGKFRGTFWGVAETIAELWPSFAALVQLNIVDSSEAGKTLLSMNSRAAVRGAMWQCGADAKLHIVLKCSLGKKPTY